ncbi:MAG: tyrosine-type recombinase/integrase, partial [Clostridiales bacterium]|nr:tyrosine-type recombinase/integrase [Clostridiales bacterium]
TITFFPMIGRTGSRQPAHHRRNSSKKATSTTIYFTFPSHAANNTTSLVLKKPKTAASIRHVYLPSTLAKWFVDFKKKQDHWKREVGKEYHDYNLAFALSNGDPISNKVLNKRFKRFLREQGYPEHDFYSLRHSGVTAKLSTTGDLKAVQGDMGDETSQMVLDIYAKIVDSDRKKIAAQIENDVFSKTNRTEDTDAETPENS